jgi:hypothetical protein
MSVALDKHGHAATGAHMEDSNWVERHDLFPNCEAAKDNACEKIVILYDNMRREVDNKMHRFQPSGEIHFEGLNKSSSSKFAKSDEVERVSKQEMMKTIVR